MISLAALVAAALVAEPIPVKTRGPLLLAEVRLNGQGPFRMVVDTGASSCSITPKVARRLHLTADYKVQDISPTGNRIIEGTRSVEVQIGTTVAKDVEFLLQPMDALGDAALDLDGVIGQTLLARYDYLLDYHSRQLILDSEEPAGGQRLQFSLASKRILLQAMNPDEGSLRLVLDSGASNVFLWRALHRSEPGSHAVLVGLTGRRGAGLLHLPVLVVGDQILERLDAVVAPSQEVQEVEDGLLPAGLFRSVYVNNSQSFVKLRR